VVGEGWNGMIDNKLDLKGLGQNEVDNSVDGKVERKKIFENLNERKWMTCKEVAHFLSMSENAVRILVYRGQIRSYKFGRRLRFLSSDCEALIQRKEV
jgi:excisionase family DNA binding protein